MVKMSKKPKLPLRDQGKAFCVGWDIPTDWAVDADGTLWTNNAHGDNLFILPGQDPDTFCDTETDRERVFRAMGKHYEPKWMVQARKHGWTPPEELQGPSNQYQREPYPLMPSEDL